MHLHIEYIIHILIKKKSFNFQETRSNINILQQRENLVLRNIYFVHKPHHRINTIIFAYTVSSVSEKYNNNNDDVL